MYSIFLSDEGGPSSSGGAPRYGATDGLDCERNLSNYMLQMLRCLHIAELKVVTLEQSDITGLGSRLSVRDDEPILERVFRSLIRDESFITLGSAEQILIVPFEGCQFNVIVPSLKEMPQGTGINVTDSTKILTEYPDAYEPFGVREIFPAQWSEIGSTLGSDQEF